VHFDKLWEHVADHQNEQSDHDVAFPTRVCHRLQTLGSHGLDLVFMATNHRFKLLNRLLSAGLDLSLCLDLALKLINFLLLLHGNLLSLSDLSCHFSLNYVTLLFFLIYLLLKFVNFLLFCLDRLQKVALEVWHDVAAAETHLRVLVQACLERLRFVGLGDFRERRFYWIHYILLWLFKIIFQSFNWGLMA